jgi:hypothetical protein
LSSGQYPKSPVSGVLISDRNPARIKIWAALGLSLWSAIRIVAVLRIHGSGFGQRPFDIVGAQKVDGTLK